MRDFDPTAGEYAGNDWSPASGRYYDIGTIASVGVPIVSSIIGSDSASDAADTQAAATNRAADVQKYIYDDSVARNQPFYDNGLAAQNKLAQLITGGGLNTQFHFDQNDLYSDPSYAFRVSEGQKAVERSAAARGMTNSGAQLKALTNYGQQAASQEYGNAYNRAQSTFNQNLNNQLNPLQSLAGVGQSTANATNALGSNYATNTGNLITSQGNAQAASQIAGGNSLSGSLSSGLNSYNQNQLLTKLLGGGGGTSSWLSAANSSSDPLGSFISLAGWGG